MSILKNRWAQVAGVITVLAIGFFAYQSNSDNGNDVTEANADVATDTTGDVATEVNTADKTVEVVNTIDDAPENTPESDDVNPVTEVETTEK